MLNRVYKSLLFMAMMTGVSYSFAQPLPTVTYKNPTLPVATRVADLLSRMTLEEKVGNSFVLWGGRCMKSKKTMFFLLINSSNS